MWMSWDDENASASEILVVCWYWKIGFMICQQEQHKMFKTTCNYMLTKPVLHLICESFLHPPVKIFLIAFPCSTSPQAWAALELQRLKEAWMGLREPSVASCKGRTTRSSDLGYDLGSSSKGFLY